MKKEERSTVLGKHRSKGTGVRQRTTPGKPRDDDFTQDWVCPKQPKKQTTNKTTHSAQKEHVIIIQKLWLTEI